MSNIAKVIIKETYQRLRKTPSDINEHLETLFEYASRCESFIEAGVRIPTSLYAISSGLSKYQDENPDSNPLMISIDLKTNEKIEEASILVNNIFQHEFHKCSDLEFQITRDYDAIFIDTFHVYGHLKRELEYFHSFINKFIIMHDTEVDKLKGEAIRMNMNIPEIMKNTGYSLNDVTTGLQPAIDEFLKNNPEWEIIHVYTNNNGLTILGRKGAF